MPPEVQILLRRAYETLEESRVLLRAGHWPGAVSRSYFSIYHASQAVMAGAGLPAMTDTRLALQESGRMDEQAYAVFSKAYAMRERADHQFDSDLGQAEAETMFADAVAFVEKACESVEA